VALRASSFVLYCDFRFLTRFRWANSYVVLVELEEMRIGSILGHRPSFIEEF
jgi:hypothetical protein